MAKVFRVQAPCCLRSRLVLFKRWIKQFGIDKHLRLVVVSIVSLFMGQLLTCRSGFNAPGTKYNTVTPYLSTIEAGRVSCTRSRGGYNVRSFSSKTGLLPSWPPTNALYESELQGKTSDTHMSLYMFRPSRYLHWFLEASTNLLTRCFSSRRVVISMMASGIGGGAFGSCNSKAQSARANLAAASVNAKSQDESRVLVAESIG